MAPTVRRTLLVLAACLLASAGALAAVLSHDAVGEPPVAATAPVGSEVVHRGLALPFWPAADELRALRPLLKGLDNYTVVLHGDGVRILATAVEPLPAGAELIVRGEVAARLEQPAVVVVRVASWSTPILG